jgi:type I restriction enzyme R subunit
MTEYGYVEKPILEWLAGRFNNPNDSGVGWKFRSAEAMEEFNRDVIDPICDGLLVPALQRINPALDTEEKAWKVAEAFSRVLEYPDKQEANRRALEVLRDGLPVVMEQGQDAITVRLIELDLAHQDRNDFTITNQYPVKGSKTAIADSVLLVNGIPLVIAEYKSFVNSGHDWREGVKQVHRYQEEAPGLLTTNVLCVAADEQELRYGTVAFAAKTDQNVRLQMDQWRPWLSAYPVERMAWNQKGDGADDDPVRKAAMSLMRPSNVLDFLENFVVFETKRGETTKKIARYQQFEAANDIVDRVLEGKEKLGLIWHTQGSGKSLTMIYAAYKLRRRRELKNPTVLVVVDRRNLKKQVGDDVDYCDYPSVVRAMGIDDLKDRLRTNYAGTIITTVQCFQSMNDLAPIERNNIILLIDEAHRTQKGKGAGFAMTMRAKLPNAYRFGMTGTPIDKTMVNTHHDFGPVIDGKQERYLSYYGIRRAILDGATLKVYYKPHYVPVAIDEAPLSVNYEQMCDELEVEDEEERELVKSKEARWKKLVKDDRRIKKVIPHLVDHFLKYPDPSGFKAMLVAVDREACGLYKDALDTELVRRGLPKEWSDVIISTRQNELPELKRYRYDADKEEELIEWYKLSPEQSEAANRKKFGDDPAKWKQPLKILIVCDKLLTGFDSPITSTMYLDKPIRDHNLLQAIARTNRPMPERNKRNGLIIDYFGVFNDLHSALNFDESVVEESIIRWDKLREEAPIAAGKCLAYFTGIHREDTRDCLMACLRRLADPGVALDFETNFKRMERLWESLSPDECLFDFRHDYTWLTSIYIAHRRRNRRALATHEELSVKTRELIQQHTEFMEIAEEVPVYKIDANYLTKVGQLPTAADRAAELESALTRELIERNNGGIVHKLLGDRLKQAIEDKEQSDAAGLKLLQELQTIVVDLNESQAEPERLGLKERGEYELFTVVRKFAAVKLEPLLIRATRTMMSRLQRGQHLPPGWWDTRGGRNKVSQTLQVESWEPDFEPLNLCPVEEAEPPFLAAAVDELGRAFATE